MPNLIPQTSSTHGCFKLPEGNHCYRPRSPLGVGRHLVHTQSPVPSSPELNSGAQICFCQANWDVAMGDEMHLLPNCTKLHYWCRCGWSHPLKRTHLEGCSVSHNTFNPGLSVHSAVKDAAVLPAGPASRTAFNV